MNVHTKALLIIASIVALCASDESLADHHDCNSPGFPKLWIGKHHISLNKTEKICIRKNDWIKIKVKFKADLPEEIKDNIEVYLGADEKPGSGIEIIEDDNTYNASNQVYKIKVGPNVTAGDEGDFWIEVEGVGLLDPRVKIIENDVYYQMLYDALKKVLAEDFDMEDVAELFIYLDGSRLE